MVAHAGHVAKAADEETILASTTSTTRKAEETTEVAVATTSITTTTTSTTAAPTTGMDGRRGIFFGKWQRLLYFIFSQWKLPARPRAFGGHLHQCSSCSPRAPQLRRAIANQTWRARQQRMEAPQCPRPHSHSRLGCIGSRWPYRLKTIVRPRTPQLLLCCMAVRYRVIYGNSKVSCV